MRRAEERGLQERHDGEDAPRGEALAAGPPQQRRRLGEDGEERSEDRESSQESQERKRFRVS